jgi:hypothetical protein
MDCFTHFLDQVLQSVVNTLPSLLDWVISRLKG